MTDPHLVTLTRHRNATSAVDVLEHATDARRSNGHHPTTGRSARGAAASAISNAVVAAFKRSCGKGPTKVKAYMLEDLVAVVARDTLTTLERTLVRGGHEQLVRQGRRALDDAVAEECGAAIEQATGQRVVGWQTEIDPIADRTVALVHLQPSPLSDLHR